MINVLFFLHAGGWREREKAREESWGPPRESDAQDDDENDRDEGERFRERRPPRCPCLTLHSGVFSLGLDAWF